MANKSQRITTRDLATLIQQELPDVGNFHVQAVLRQMANVINEQVAQGKSVQLAGIGTFGNKRAQARTMFKPTTRERVDIPPRILPKFSASSRLKNSVASIDEGDDD